MMIFKNIKQYFITKKNEKKEIKQRQEELTEIVKKISNIDLNMPKSQKTNLKLDKIDSKKMSYKEKIKQEKVEEELSEQRQKELIKIIEHLKEIDLSKPKNKVNKIDIISMINIEKMNNDQLKNTYKFIKKSIIDSTEKNRLEEVERLKKLKQQIKKKLLEKSDDLEKISINLKTGNFDNIDEYEQYLLNLYNEINQKKLIKFEETTQARKIKILTLLKLIKKN